MDEERRDSSAQLTRAQQKITTLEEFIRDRERQFHSAVVRLRLERRDSRHHRLRRVGRSHDVLLRMRSMSREEPDEDLDAYSHPLSEYVSLKLIRILEHGNSEEPIPFVLRRLIGRSYDISPDGATIGTASDCTVSLPREAEVFPRHLEIKWQPLSKKRQVFTSNRRGSKLARQDHIEDGGHFVLVDLAEGRGVFHISYDSPNLQQSCILEREDSDGGSILSPDSSVGIQIDQSDASTSILVSTTESNTSQTTSQSDSTIPTDQSECTSHIESSPFRTMLTHGIKFITGRVEWAITALPQERVLTLRMFAAARQRNLDELRHILDSISCSNLTIPFISVTPASPGMDHTGYKYSSISVVTDQGLDVNTEYQPPFYADDPFYNQLFSRRRSSAQISRAVSPTPSRPLPPRLLLHIAIENEDLEMVKFLLERGANVNRSVGDLGQNALHLAAQRDIPAIMEELLRYGGDVESQDGQHLLPLALTSNYEIRKLLLSTVLLCAAAEAGDHSEVVRLLSTSRISPNAKGLRHKTALHLASARGHQDVVELLLMNGANVNAKGGSRQRTPLHYASLNNHVAIATLLLQAGANEFARDSGGYTPLNLSLGGDMCLLLHKQPLSLCLAVQSKDLDFVEQILVKSEGRGGEGEGERERVVDQRNEQSHAPLHLACTTGNIKIARVLVAHGADVNLHGGSDSWTPLFYAAMAGHEVVVEFLLSVGADIEEEDCHGNTVQERVEQAMEEIKDRKAYLEKRGRSESVVEETMHTLLPASMLRQESTSSCSVASELLWLSRRYERLREVSLLLTSGPDRLLKAIETRNLRDFTQLLESGAVSVDVVVERYRPTPALVRVCEKGLYEFAEQLLKFGANASPSGPQDQIPLLVAAGNGHSDIVQLLVEHGANINTQSSDTLTTPLHEAATANNLETVEYLLSLGASADSQNAAGETPFDCTTLLDIRKLLASGPNKLLVAASEGDHEAIQHLVKDEGISPSHEFQLGITALHEACEGGHNEAVESLLSLGADVNKQTYTTQISPLHIASRANHLEVARLLLGAGAKLDTKDSEGKVPFEVACTNQMRKVLVEARSVKPQPVSLGSESSSERRCMICMDKPINTIILPCGHQAFCTNCVSRITTCALDRQPIREVITVFK